MHKLVIPSAGLGTRIGPYSKFKNKGLLTIGQRPAISHVIDSFRSINEIVVILGYQGDALRDALISLYPHKELSFIEVDLFSGPGSGLGHSLCAARDLLQCPFIFSPNDAIFINSPEKDFLLPKSANLLGYYRSKDGDNYRLEEFRTIEIDNSKVAKILPKGRGSNLIYTGVCRVDDYSTFWDAMSSDLAIEAGEVIGLASLDQLDGIELDSWNDCGTLESLEHVRNLFRDPSHTILEKENEAIWFSSSRVVKFSSSSDFIRGRVERHSRLPKSLVPVILDVTDHTYVYSHVPGSTLDVHKEPLILFEILDKMYELAWSIPDTKTDSQYLKSLGLAFYRDKTLERCKEYQIRYEETDRPLIINGSRVTSLEDALCRIDWVDLADNCRWAGYHGDFHPDNIIINGSGFYLIDWRQDFGSNFYESGDVYYDLAKFNHGLEINHRLISDGSFKVDWKNRDEVRIDLLQRMSLLNAKRDLYYWITSKHFLPHRVDLITSLIYLNIAVLHEYPYSQFLHLFGRLSLHRYLAADRDVADTISKVDRIGPSSIV